MTITNLTAYTTYPEIESNRTFPDSPKLHIEFDIVSDTLHYTYVQGSIEWVNNATVPQTAGFLSNKAYGSHVQYSMELPVAIPVHSPFTVRTIVYGAEAGDSIPKKVAELTEKVDYPKYSPVVTLSSHNFRGGYLKAFCNFSNSQSLETYCTWEKSTDGINLTPVQIPSANTVNVKSLASHVQDSELDLDNPSSSYIAKPCYIFKGNSAEDELSSRYDILEIPMGDFEGAIYSFKIFTVKKLDSPESLQTSSGNTVQCDYTEDCVLGYTEFKFVSSNTTDILHTEFSNAASGKLFYSNNVAFSYGIPNLKNNVLASYPGELVTPMSRVIDLPAKGYSNVTALAAWRDYIIAATDFEIFLISKTAEGFFTKIVSTFIGIPAEDYKCLKATANGLIFKSHGKVYMFYPNVYSSDESVLNLTDISKSVEHLLEDYPEDSEYIPFALSTESAYYIIMPDAYGEQKTKCLKYAYNTRTWTFFEYPVLITDYSLRSVNDIIVYGRTGEDVIEYAFESDANLTDKIYGDTLTVDTVTPIHFELDSGQRTDSLNHSKQFVESKFNVITLHEKDSFPMRVTIHVDGCPTVVTRDVNTDSAFWKQSKSDLGTLSTNFSSNASDIFNVFRQMFVRYSGKGKSVRHIIEGESLYPFKIYEIDYRYRNLNIKQ